MSSRVTLYFIRLAASNRRDYPRRVDESALYLARKGKAPFLQFYIGDGLKVESGQIDFGHEVLEEGQLPNNVIYEIGELKRGYVEEAIDIVDNTPFNGSHPDYTRQVEKVWQAAVHELVDQGLLVLSGEGNKLLKYF